MRWQHSVGEIIRSHWTKITTSGIFNRFKLKHLSAISKCRTAALGGHIDACDACGFYKISYNSCGNRHCPTCGALKRETWIVRQEEKLLNVPYFHVVFTTPHELNELCLQHPRLLYGLLFKTAWQTVQAFAADPKYLEAKTGMTAVLHTWGQNLSLHPHLHCIIPGGGLTTSGKWKTTRSNGKYLFPRNALRKVFKGKFMAALKDLAAKEAIELPDAVKEKLYRKKWVVYAKRPFAKPENVIEYLGRYTHKTAISNYRLKEVKKHTVKFSYKDYKTGGAIKKMTLAVLEFIRRFALHILPHGFARIRHFGILSSRGQVIQIPLIQSSMGIEKPKLTKAQLRQKALNRLKTNAICSCCGQKKLQRILPFPRGEPPDENYILNQVLRMNTL
ncbi:MAG: IS91 family transposase [Saprospiraceae bacterium]